MNPESIEFILTLGVTIYFMYWVRDIAESLRNISKK